jgi:hypothetical protein
LIRLIFCIHTLSSIMDERVFILEKRRIHYG